MGVREYKMVRIIIKLKVELNKFVLFVNVIRILYCFLIWVGILLFFM